MAIRFDADGDYLYRTTNVPASSAFSLAGWVYLVSDRNAVGAICQIISSGGVGPALGVGADGTTLQIAFSGTTTTGSSLTTGQWYHVALVKNGSAVTALLNGVQDIAQTNTTAFTSAYVLLNQATAWTNSRMGNWRVWSAALTPAEILAEMYSNTPVRTADLNAAYLFTSSTTADSSGAGNNLTAAGTLALETPEPPTLVLGGVAGAVAGAAVSAAAGGTGAVDATVAGLPASARAGAPAGAVSAGTNATVVGLPAAARAGSARAAASATPVTSIKLGIIGDSDLDEYRANDNRGGSYASVTYNSAELMVNVLGYDLGSWATRAEPRRTGYAQNWARSSATLGGVHNGSGGSGSVATNQGQHTGLAAQVTAGDVDTALVFLGSNDYNPGNGCYGEIYDGTVSGSELTAKINSILANLETIVDELIAAGCQRILVANFADPGPYVTATYPNATFRQRVTDAITTTNSGVASIIAARAACQLYDRYNQFSQLFDGYTRTPGVSFVVAGETITETAGDEPHNWILADNHFGTVLSGLQANAIIRRYNAAFGFSLSTMTDSQIIAQITGNATVTGLPAAARVGASAGAASGAASVSGLPAAAKVGAGVGVVSAGASLAGLPAAAMPGAAGSALAANANLAALPAAVMAGAAVSVVSTGLSVTVVGLPAAAMTGAGLSAMSAGASLSALPAVSQGGSAGGAVSAGGQSAIVTGVPASSIAGCALAIGQSDVQLPAAIAGSSANAAAGLVTVAAIVVVLTRHRRKLGVTPYDLYGGADAARGYDRLRGDDKRRTR